MVYWNKSGSRPLLCTYRLNWARRTSWGWWDDTALQDSTLKPRRSEAENATSRSRRLPTILSFTSGWGRNIFSFKTSGTGKQTLNSGVKGSGAHHYPRAPALSCVHGTTSMGVIYAYQETIIHVLYYTICSADVWITTDARDDIL